MRGMRGHINLYGLRTREHPPLRELRRQYRRYMFQAHRHDFAEERRLRDRVYGLERRLQAAAEEKRIYLAEVQRELEHARRNIPADLAEKLRKAAKDIWDLRHEVEQARRAHNREELRHARTQDQVLAAHAHLQRQGEAREAARKHIRDLYAEQDKMAEHIKCLGRVLDHRHDTIRELRAELAVHPLRRWLRQLFRRKP